MWARQLLSDSGADVWVEAVIVLTRASLPKGTIARHSVRIVSLDNLVPLIRAGRHHVTAHDVALLVDRVHHRVLPTPR